MFSSCHKYYYILSNSDPCKTTKISKKTTSQLQIIYPKSDSKIQASQSNLPQSSPFILSVSNNYNCKQQLLNPPTLMKNESKSVRDQKSSKSRVQEVESTAHTKPVKSPSPDRKPSNVIVNTRSPGLQEIKKQITPIKEEATALKILQKIEHREKYTPIETPKHPSASEERPRYCINVQGQAQQEESTTLKQQNRTKHNTESKTNPRQQRHQMPSEFQVRLSSQQHRGRAGQLDYLRLLKQKQETIKQLRDLLQMIDRSNSTGQLQENERVRLLERRLREYSKQVKVLEIENQCLISVIENNHVNIPSNKEEILQREIRELRESLAILQQESTEELQQAKKRIVGLEAEIKQLERECDKLLKLLREKQNVERKESTGSSSHSLVSKDRERVTLSKIKEQYNQNLRLAQQNFENQYRDCYESFRKIIEKQSSRIDYYMLRIQDLEQALQSRKYPKTNISSAPSAHQEIESLLLQKYSKYMRELDEQKKVNEKLNLQLSIAWKSLRELEMKSFNTSQDILNDSNNEEISELSQRNSTLKNKIKELETANVALKDSLQQLVSLKAKEIQELEVKMEAIIDVYESKLKNDKAQLESLREQSSQRQSRLREQQSQRQRVIQQKIKLIIQTFEKQAEIYKETLQSRANAISALQQENHFLRFELEACLNVKEKETDISKISENEKMIQAMENELKQTKSRLQQNEERLIVLQQERKSLLQLNSVLQNDRYDAKTRVQTLLQENGLILQALAKKSGQADSLTQQCRLLHQTIQEKNQMLNKLNQNVLRLQEENNKQLRELQQIRQLNLKTHGQSFEDQLQSLKQSIASFLSKYSEQATGKNLENYFTIENLYESKIDENVKLRQEIFQLKDALNRDSLEKSRLTEKVANLEKNVAIYEQQLKERKVLYEGLLKEKARIEKEIILAKKLKDTQTTVAIEKMAGSVGEITGQIDKLVQLQRTRNNLISRLFIFQ